MEKKWLFHLHFDDIPQDEFINSLRENIEKKEKVSVCTPNLDFLRNSYKNSEVRKAYNTSTYITIDGKIVYILSKLFRSGIKNKFSGSDMAYPILDMADANAYKVFLFGGKEGVSEQASKKIKEQYKNIIICGTYSPPFGFENDEDEVNRITDMLSKAEPDIVFLCCGSPKTELFYYRNKEALPNAVYLCLGATIDFIAGSIKRAPKWMSVCGLEWLYRLCKDPKRLLKRYFLDGIFLFKIIFLGIFRKKKINNMREM